MEQMRYDYSLKNIPVANEKEYIKALIMKAEKFIINCRWKALAYKKKFKGQQNNYGFKSPNCPQIVRELIPIELDIVNMIKNIVSFAYIDSSFVILAASASNHHIQP